MYKKILIYFIIFITTKFSPLLAQYYDPEKAKQVNELPKENQPKPLIEAPNIWDKLYFGGNIGLQFGTFTVIQLSPLVGYNFTKSFSAGGILNYSYINSFRTSYSIYGISPFARLMILENFFLMGELSVINMPDFKLSNVAFDRDWVVSPLLGAGYLLSFGKRGGMMLSVLYNFNNSNRNSRIATNSYGPFVIRTGFFF